MEREYYLLNFAVSGIKNIEKEGQINRQKEENNKDKSRSQLNKKTGK